MAFYQSCGTIPAKRHVVHKVDGGHTYEELVSRAGFSDICSNVYHLRMPTAVSEVGPIQDLPRQISADGAHRMRHLRTGQLGKGGDWLSGRRVLAYNDACVIATCAPDEQPDWFYRNARADELVFVHHGSGTLQSMFGDLKFEPGDYIVIPRGVIHRYVFDAGRIKLLVVESTGPIDTPRHFRNDYGQLLEHAPYCERDIRTPEFVEPVDWAGAFKLKIKLGAKVQTVTLANHPFDVVGWDGFYYPWIFNIRDFMPAVGKVHLPPPVHLTFTSPGFVVCSFVPRLFDFHDDAIPIPYAHANVDSDEVLYYVEGNFMSRKGIEEESITLHPMGYTHGPQPGLLEKALGQRGTRELAVMIDTFAPLTVTDQADEVDDADYPLSWNEA